MFPEENRSSLDFYEYLSCIHQNHFFNNDESCEFEDLNNDIWVCIIQIVCLLVYKVLILSQKAVWATNIYMYYHDHKTRKLCHNWEVSWSCISSQRYTNNFLWFSYPNHPCIFFILYYILSRNCKFWGAPFKMSETHSSGVDFATTVTATCDWNLALIYL